MERRTKSFLDEISGPFVPPPKPTEKVETIRTELPKLVKAGIKKLNPDQLDRLTDYYLRMKSRKQEKIYKEKYPDDHKRFHFTPTGKQLRILRYISFLLSN